MEEDFSKYNGEGTVLRNAQLRMLDILAEVDRICRKYDIRYWIDYGTLLGAVRHKGFIPWDDDLDITMMTEDLKKFIKIAPSELPDNLFLQTKATDPSYKFALCKVRDKKSLFITQHEDFTRNYNKGLYIDIFEAEKYPHLNSSVLKLLMKWEEKTTFFFNVKHYFTVKNIVAALCFPVIHFLIELLWKILLLKSKRDIGYIPKLNYYGVSFKKDTVFPLSEIDFEGKLFMAPHDVDTYLRTIYNNYTELPPVEKRRDHSKYIFID